MYKPVPLNWIAGDDSSLCTGPPHFGQTSRGGSENFWILSKRCPQASHSYSYSGIAVQLYSSRVAAGLAQHQLPMQPERRGAVAEQRVVERPQRERLALLLPCSRCRSFSSISLPTRVDQIRRIERAALGFAARAGLLEERLVAEEADALLDRHVLAVQPDADDEAARAGSALRRAGRGGCSDPAAEPASIIICSQ